MNDCSLFFTMKIKREHPNRSAPLFILIFFAFLATLNSANKASSSSIPSTQPA